uniref:Uncharacterized protein n=1 Tax=Anguilla anguilla TaxID=7936 RepID=A0A0E9XPI5_ANGAN
MTTIPPMKTKGGGANVAGKIAKLKICQNPWGNQDRYVKAVFQHSKILTDILLVTQFYEWKWYRLPDTSTLKN